MLGFGGTTVDFLPDPESRSWIARTLGSLRATLPPAPRAGLVFPGDLALPVSDLDVLFEVLCGLQEATGQADVEFDLVELEGDRPGLPPGFAPLGDPTGQLLHTFHREGHYAVLCAPAVFRVQSLTLASAAREVARMALHRAGTSHEVDESDREAHTELGAVTLGLGVLVANGSYVYEKACCGGGCGLDLASVRAGLSMPEACFALALDATHRGLPRRAVAKHLEPTQGAAFKAAHAACGKEPALLAAGARTALGGGLGTRDTRVEEVHGPSPVRSPIHGRVQG
jgi:hypothetical protein